MNINPYNYMNESVIKKTIHDYAHMKKLMKRSINQNATFVFVGYMKLELYRQQMEMHEERWKKMEEFRKSELKRELMERMFHPNNIHKFVDWGFIDESDIE